MNTLAIEEKPYRIEGYYPNVPSFVDGTFRGKPTFMQDSEESKALNSLLMYYSEDEIAKGRRDGDTLMPFYLARCWTYICYLFQTHDLRGKKWCDMSAGWGVHLLSAMLAGMEYYSCDPNSAMHPVYQRMISDYRGKATVHNAGFETSVVAPAEEEYDIFFSSPPYFDWEIYSEDEGQSVKMYPDFIHWVTDFLFPCVTKGVRSVKVGGYIILYMQDVLTIRFCEAVLFYIHEYHPELQYEGIISCGGKSKLYPSFIWRKVASYNRANKRDVSFLDDYYTRISLRTRALYEGRVPTAPSYTPRNLEKGNVRWKVRGGEIVGSFVQDKTKIRGMEAYFYDNEREGIIQYTASNYVLQEEMAIVLLCQEYNVPYRICKGRKNWEVIRSMCVKLGVMHDFVMDLPQPAPYKYFPDEAEKKEYNKARRKEYLLLLQAYNTRARNEGVVVIDYTAQITYKQQMRRSLDAELRNRATGEMNFSMKRCYISATHRDVYEVLVELFPQTHFVVARSDGDEVYQVYDSNAVDIVNLSRKNPRTGKKITTSLRDYYVENYQSGDYYWEVEG
jgi:hypothetical protein